MENWLLGRIIGYGLNRLKEPSTWAALAATLAASLHTQFNTDFTNGFITVGVAISALIAILAKEGATK